MIGDMMTVIQLFSYVYFVSITLATVFFAVRLIKGESTKRLFINYLKILGIGVFASFFPFMTFGVMFGFPSVLMASIIITYVFRKELA